MLKELTLVIRNKQALLVNPCKKLRFFYAVMLNFQALSGLISRARCTRWKVKKFA